MRRPLFTVCLCLVAAVALLLSPGIVRKKADTTSVPANGEWVTITGKVYQKDIEGMDSQTFRIKSVKQSIEVSATESWQTFPISENLICEVKTLENIRMGSVVTLQGYFKEHQCATNPGEFDAANYYRAQGIGGRLTNIRILAVGKDYSLISETLYQIKCYFRNRLYRVFPEKEASVMTAMLLGDKQELDQDTKNLYMENGVIHILSISGLHITMIGMGIYRLFRRVGIPLVTSACVGAMVLLGYGILTGMGVSACRAIGMYLLRMMAVIVGRTYDMLTALGVMALLLVVQNPANLQNAGFLLSFGSILGVGMLYPAILPGKERDVPALLRSLLAGASITLFTLPIQLWFYYEISTYSILINVLILPFMSCLMLTGLVAMLLPGAGVIGTVSCLILQGYEWVCNLFNQLPYHTWNPGKPEPWQVICYYGMILVLIGWKHRTQEKTGKLRYLSVAATLCLAIGIMGLRLPEDRVTFLDVGQGDGMVMETATGEVFLFDCGSSSRKKVGEYVLLPYLKCRGIRHIDAVFLSHGDEDHCSGIKELLETGKQEGISVERLILSDIKENLRETEFGELLRMVNPKETAVSYVRAGQSFATESFSLLCLHPPRGYVSESSNGNSLCFFINRDTGDGNKISLLLTGDVEKQEEEMLIKELKHYGIESVTLLKVAHHGSKNATSEELLEQIKPQVAIISCGKNNSYGHPHEETLLRLKNETTYIFTTPEYGAVTVKIGRNFRISGF